MTPSSRRAGEDHPRPASSGRLATRAASLALMTLLLAGALAGTAAAAADPPVPPVTIGPVDAIPPPPPVLPGTKAGRKGPRPAGVKHDDKPAGGGSRSQGAHETKGSKEGTKLDLRASCAPLAHTQTYAAWGPAVSYGGPVTVVYAASRCSTPDGLALDVAAEGTAQIFEGTDTTGALLDTKPFLVSGRWKQPRNAAAWPPTWWDCSVAFASYTWQIPGVYTFQVSARDGVWTLNVSSRGLGTQDVSWTHDGCA